MGKLSSCLRQAIDIVDWLVVILRAYASAYDLGKVLGSEFMIRLGARRRLRVPDILFLAKDRLHFLRKNHLEGAPDLAIEVVSADSQSRDRRDKYADYEAAGVLEYWIIDPIGEDLEVHVLDPEGKYQPLPINEGVVASTVLTGLSLRVESFWQSPMPNEWQTLRGMGLPA